MARAFVFPGQGSQAVGMGAELAKASAAARAVFAEVDDALGQKLSDLMFNGPIETLTLTENAQPALMAASLAVIRVLEQERGFRLAEKVKFVAGHSLGGPLVLRPAGGGRNRRIGGGGPYGRIGWHAEKHGAYRGLQCRALLLGTGVEPDRHEVERDGGNGQVHL